MGEVGPGAMKPDQFLKKNARDEHFQKRVKSARGHREKDHVICADMRRPPVPKVTDHIATPYRTRRSFINKNALDAMLSEPTKNSNQQFVDAPNGNTQPLKQSGMVPQFVEKREFGRVPGYLKRFKEERKIEVLKWEAEQEEIRRQKDMMKLQPHERQEILQVRFQLVA